MFQSKKAESSHGVRHAPKFSLHKDVSCSTQCTHTLNTQLLCVIAERAIHISSHNGWAEFWPEPIKFLVDMLNHTHWLWMAYKGHSMCIWWRRTTWVVLMPPLPTYQFLQKSIIVFSLEKQKFTILVDEQPLYIHPSIYTNIVTTKI